MVAQGAGNSALEGDPRIPPNQKKYYLAKGLRELPQLLQNDLVPYEWAGNGFVGGKLQPFMFFSRKEAIVLQ